MPALIAAKPATATWKTTSSQRPTIAVTNVHLKTRSTMPKRIDTETLYLRHEFTAAERLEMGASLAEAHNRLAAIEDELAAVKAQFKERSTKEELAVGTLSRNLSNGFEMRNIPCTLEYDMPNVGEVSYRRKDNGQFVKARPMTEQERQLDLPLEEKTEEQAAVAVEQSAKAAEEWFTPVPEGALDAPADEEKEAEEKSPLETEAGKTGKVEVIKPAKANGKTRPTADF
jgi:hypothetical protein